MSVSWSWTKAIQESQGLSKKKVYTHPLPFNRNIESLLLMKLTFEFNDLNGKGHFANDMNLILMCDVYKGKINKRSFGQLH